ncbi:MAG: type IV secretory system conjugative DNA transfer family protein [Clostridia bacterium]|nr:type IV secretory system conjugative DNA transfer family protein [Clostridia bacterium]
MRKIDVFKDYENTKLLTVEEYRQQHTDATFKFDELGKKNIDGIPLCITRGDDGKLDVTFTPDTHLLAIGATRSGKTTGYVIPTINVLAAKKNKPNMVISDPKKELYERNAKMLEKQGYRVLLLDFTDYRHSDCWNPLTKYFRLYRKYCNITNEVMENSMPNGNGFQMDDKKFRSLSAMLRYADEKSDGYFDEVEKGLTTLVAAIVPKMDTKDPFWEDSARDLLKAILYGMLEDSKTGKITEDNFSFDTALRIMDSFSDARGRISGYDNGYFSQRDKATSKARNLAHKCILEQAENTRRCITSTLATKMNKFRDTSVRRITCANTFEMSELDDGAPTAIFVAFKDEEELHYEIITMFLSTLYTELIAIARSKGSQLDRPFYFLLDEFGNLPPFNSFDKVISACGGRNIWFLLILQSYAQLYNVYGKETAEIIKDNLNTHLFFGTNNPQTKRDFSEECGLKTVIAPTSALNGKGESIEVYEKDVVPLVPVSKLTKIAPGECVVTQMRADVLWSRMERSYLCKEFTHRLADTSDRPAKLDFSNKKYIYKID